jgi:ribose transport system substrate-binding protein
MVMRHFRRPSGRVLGLAIACLALGLVVAGCGSSSSGSSSTTASSSGSGSSAGGLAGAASLQTAQKQLEAAYQGHYTHPPTESNPATPGKSVWILSCGESSPPCAIGVHDMAKAGELLGWKIHIFDGKLLTSEYAQGIKDAIAAGANGFLTVSYECPAVKSALQQAKAAGLKSSGMWFWDCDELSKGAEPLYSNQNGFGTRYPSQDAVYQATGSDQAAWALVEAGGNVKAIDFRDNAYNTELNQELGFDNRLKELCPKCENNDVYFTATEFGTAAQAKTVASLTKYPDTNVIKATSNPELGFLPGIAQAGKTSTVKSVGGWGIPENMESVREGKLGASFAWPIEWIAFGAVDSLNRAFNGKAAVDEGYGWTLVTKTHNLPPKGQGYSPDFPFREDYEKAWGLKK